METNKQNSPSSGIKNLYIGHINEIIGRINDSDRRKVRLQGEVLLYGQIDSNNVFIVEQIRRVALYGTLLKPPKGDRLGLISLVGPLNRVTLQPDQTVNLPLQLHYSNLSNLGPINRNSDGVFPTVEMLTATLSWKLNQAVTPSEQEGVLLDIGLPASGVTKLERGLIEKITFEPAPILFRSANRLLPLPQPYDSLSLWNCGSIDPCAQGKRIAEAHFLPLKFINISTTTGTALQTIIDDALAGMCEVWWKKAALLISNPILDEVSALRSTYGTIDASIDTPGSKQKTLPSAYHGGSTQSPPHYVEVYLIDNLQNRSEGGITHNAGQASAYSIMAVNALSQNKYLLAHELGHALGVDHPNVGINPGSPNSVMDDATIDSINTECNCKIFSDYLSTIPTGSSVPVGVTITPLSAIVVSVGAMECCNPDPDPVPCLY